MSLSGPANIPGDHLENESSRPAKRVRVAVACTRCKYRKQRCDGGQPACGNCKNSFVYCEYIVPSASIPFGKYQYIKSLEARVLELETTVAAAGLSDPGDKTWDHGSGSGVASDSRRSSQSSAAGKQPEDPNIMEATQYLRDLSLHAGGGFVGDESSNATVGQLFMSIAQTESRTTPSKRSNVGRIYCDPGWPDPLANMPRDLAEKLLNGYLKHISTRWVILHRPHVIHLHQKNMVAALVDPFEVSDLNLVYALGGRFLETVGDTVAFHPETFYEAALRHFDFILKAQDIKSAQTLLLHAVHSLRTPGGLGAWTNVGLAIRICISLGLHRKISSPKATLATEIRKRVFWSCYCLDRQVSIMLGRPFAISDRDIDVELPLDVPDWLSDASIQAMSTLNRSQPSVPSTSLSCFVHVTRLRRIESEIQSSIYRVDKHKPLPRSKIDWFLSTLADWRAQVPPDHAENDTQTYSYDGILYYEIYYYQCIRLLLYPHLNRLDLDPDLIEKCANACGSVVRSWKHLHQVTIVGLSLMAVYTIFISGLNLLYCMWLSPANTYNMESTNDLNACSVVLHVVAERWPIAKRYQDAFEAIKQSILNLLENGNTGGRVPIANLGSQGGLKELGSQGLHPEGQREFSAMISDMSGGVNEQNPQQRYRKGSKESNYGRSDSHIFGRGNTPRIQLTQPPLPFVTPETRRTPRFQYPFPQRDSPRGYNQATHSATHTSISPTDVRTTMRNEFPFPQEYVPPPPQPLLQQQDTPIISQNQSMYLAQQISMTPSEARAMSLSDYPFPQYPPLQTQTMHAQVMSQPQPQSQSQSQPQHQPNITSFSQQYSPQQTHNQNQNPFDFSRSHSYQDIASTNFNTASGSTNRINSNEYSFLNMGLPSVQQQQQQQQQQRQNEHYHVPTSMLDIPDDFDIGQFLDAGGFDQNRSQSQDHGHGHGHGQNQNI